MKSGPDPPDLERRRGERPRPLPRRLDVPVARFGIEADLDEGLGDLAAVVGVAEAGRDDAALAVAVADAAVGVVRAGAGWSMRAPGRSGADLTASSPVSLTAG
ncbi:MAG: hypothetical protein GY719_35615 [bacterium]|nr:hypothetical protein [bacterium]